MAGSVSEPNTPFNFLRKQNQLEEVGMDEMKLWLPTSGKAGIGTQGLNGCTCIVLLGNQAILMAHVSPYPGAFQQGTTRNLSQESATHHQRFLDGIASTVAQNPGKFPPDTTAWGIFSFTESKDPAKAGISQPIYNQVAGGLHKLGYNMRSHFYQEIRPRDIVAPKSQVVALLRSGKLHLYAEREQLWPLAQQMQMTSATPSSSQSAASSSAQRTPPQQAIEVVDWWGYPIESESPGQRKLKCVVAGQTFSYSVSWTEGQEYPRIFTQGVWVQTKIVPGADLLVVPTSRGDMRLERPSAA